MMKKTIRKTLRRREEERSGVAMLEMAVILPLLMLFTAAILDFGSAIYVFDHMSHAAREGARTRARELPSGPILDPDGNPYIDDAVTVATDYLNERLPGTPFTVTTGDATEDYAWVEVTCDWDEAMMTSFFTTALADRGVSIRHTLEYQTSPIGR